MPVAASETLAVRVGCEGESVTESSTDGGEGGFGGGLGGGGGGSGFGPAGSTLEAGVWPGNGVIVIYSAQS